MKEHPIIFSAPMVRAILEDRKTQTRRVCKQAIDPLGGEFAGAVHLDGSNYGWIAWFPGKNITPEFTKKAYPGDEGFHCPYGKPCDRLWVRETWARRKQLDGITLTSNYITWPTWYKADGASLGVGCLGDVCGKWRTSIHMPRWASRITLEITNIRVERVQDISVVDAIAEGAPLSYEAQWWFKSLWDSIYSSIYKKGIKSKMHDKEHYDKSKIYSWDKNPFVWVIEFKRVK